MTSDTSIPSQWEINHSGVWAWLGRSIAMGGLIQTTAFDRIEQEYNQ